jgi:ABC-2 type transport system permease protein
MRFIEKARIKYRYSIILLKELVITDFKIRYQGSVLGYLWTVLRPLFIFIILYIVFVYFLRIGSNIPYWPVQLLLGIVLWNFFTEVTNGGITSIVDRGDVIRKINFPKYIIILSSTISALINLGINMLIILVFMFFAGVSLRWGMLVAPIYIVELFIFALGLTFLLSSIYVKLRDVNYIWEIIMQGLFYASVVIYPISLVIEKGTIFAQILLLNPVAQIIQDTRYFLISDQVIVLKSLTTEIYWYIIPFIVVTLTALVGSIIFKKQSSTFAENV